MIALPMTDTGKPPLSPEDYDAILGAVLETARGRWFLAEHARRNRHAETAVLLEAIARLEKMVASQQPAVAAEDIALRREVAEMSEALQRAKREVAASLAEERGVRRLEADRALDDLLAGAERADRDTFNAAEHVQEIAWALRETRDIDRATAELDRQAAEIYRASNQHALTSQRLRSLVSVFRLLDARTAHLVASWSSKLAFVGDEPEPQGTPQLRFDTIITAPDGGYHDDIVFAPALPEDFSARLAPKAPGPEPEPGMPARPAVPAPALTSPAPLVAVKKQPEPDPRLAHFAAVDALSPEQRLALFA
jgi:hypothetical protein